MLFLPITFTSMRSVYLSCKQVVTYNEYELINRCDVLTEEAGGRVKASTPRHTGRSTGRRGGRVKASTPRHTGRSTGRRGGRVIASTPRHIGRSTGRRGGRVIASTPRHTGRSVGRCGGRVKESTPRHNGRSMGRRGGRVKASTPRHSLSCLSTFSCPGQMTLKAIRLRPSRMHTARPLTISSSMLCAGGCLVWGVPGREGVWYPSMH